MNSQLKVEDIGTIQLNFSFVGGQNGAVNRRRRQKGQMHRLQPRFLHL